MITPDRILEIISPALGEESVAVLDIRTRGQAGRLHISLTLDMKDRNITIDECGRWSRLFEDLLDGTEDIPRQYALEVSSPGLKTPLKYVWQFNKNLTRTLKVTLKNAVENDTKVIVGRLDEVNDQGITIDIDNNKISVLYSNIEEAIIALPW